ncbi:MAG TPA: CBS domain-containing protein, partial [Thermomicrobiales bacterium]|nr:CBS domain-containing protein [Thermomicrobiales bacterium]
MQTLSASTLRDLLETRDAAELVRLAPTLHASEWVDLIHQLDDDEVATLLDLLPDDIAVEILAELDPEAAADLLAKGTPASTAAIIAEMEPDDAADVVAEMDDDRAAEVLSELPSEDASTLRELLAYPEGSAGALMTPEFVAIAPMLRADQAIEALRAIAADAEVTNYVYVLDRQDHLLGVLSLRNLVLAQPHEQVQNLMIVPAVSVTTDTEAQVAANLLRDRNLLALPVVDAENRLQGIITHDDATEVLEDELTEDYLKMAGTDADEMARRNPAQIA